MPQKSLIAGLLWLAATASWGATDCPDAQGLEAAIRTATTSSAQQTALEQAALACPGNFNFQYRLALNYQRADKLDAAKARYLQAMSVNDGSLLAMGSVYGRLAEVALGQREKINAESYVDVARLLFDLRARNERQAAPEWFNAVVRVVAEQDWANASPQDLAAVLSKKRSLANKVAERGVKVLPSVDLRIQFGTDSAALNGQGADQSARLAEALRLVKPTGTVTIVGHTDQTGSDAFNQKLSEKRAEAVVAELKKRLPEMASQFRTEGHGKNEPLVPGTDPASLALNRRVEIRLGD
ncbi:OmpA family protein [Andreprevotia chitinilytica]|uniref:OmpA family protein n=1 Tax=Andreprevotia chitinilytica TaxID=396808 RepID=UPI00068A7A06|nr:OmpA family protein [Andreprevotia chitinilytica]